MELELLSLQSLCGVQQAMTVDQFTQTYAGAFLLPMGFLSVQDIRAAQDLESTAGVRFGQPLRHDPKQSHPLAGRAFFIRAGDAESSCSLGRGPECDITVPDESVSQEHCRLQVSSDYELWVTDLGSTNGSKVNLDQVQVGSPKALGVEDILTVGRYSFQVHTAQSLYDALSLISRMGK